MKTLLADKRDPFTAIVQPGTKVCLEVSLDLLQRIPSIFAPVKDRRMGSLGEVERSAGLNMGEVRRKQALNHFFHGNTAFRRIAIASLNLTLHEPALEMDGPLCLSLSPQGWAGVRGRPLPTE